MTDISKQPLAEIDGGTSSVLPQSLATSPWAFINGWKVEPQHDDRTPVIGAVAPHIGSASARRSKARAKHQAMFKEWSQGRHD